MKGIGEKVGGEGFTFKVFYVKSNFHILIQNYATKTLRFN